MAQEASTRINIQDLHEDVLDHIFEEISDKMVADDDDRISLAACLLVSKTFRHFALPRLYFQIIISNSHLGAGNPHGISLLREVLSPPDNVDLEQVAAYIKVLSIGFAAFENVEEKVQMSKDLMNHPDFVYILGQMHQETFGVFQFRFEFTYLPEGLKWSDLNPASQGAIQSLICSPFLTDLAIDCVDILPRDLVVSSNVKRLTLTRFSPQYIRHHATQISASAPITIDSPPGLERLVSDTTYQYNTVKGVKILEMRLPKATVSANALDLIKECADTLTQLVVDHTAILKPFQELFPSFRLDNTPKLEYFYLQENCNYPSSEDTLISPMPFHQVLNVSAPMAFLRELHLGYWYVFIQDPYDLKKDPVWEQLDELLTGPMYPSIEMISITVHRRPRHDWESIDERRSKELTDYVRKLLPRLSSSRKAFHLKITTGNEGNPAYRLFFFGPGGLSLGVRN